MSALFIDGSMSHAGRVASWYRRVRCETDVHGNNFSVNDPQLIGNRSGGMSLTNLLSAISTAMGAGDSPTRIVVVCHGNEEGLAIPLVSRVNQANRRAHRIYLGMLSGRYALGGNPVNILGSESSESRAPTDQELADLLTPITQTEIRELRQLMRNVQGLHIEHLDLRACNLAQASSSRQVTLEEIAHFFGIPHVCGPITRDGFGPLNVQIIRDGAALSRRTSEMVRYPDLRAGQQRNILVYMQRRGRRPLLALSGSRENVARWMMQSFVPGNLTGNVFRVTPEEVPDEMSWHGFEASPSSSYHPSFVFPGMPAYHGHLREHFASSLVSSSPTPLPVATPSRLGMAEQAIICHP